MLHKNIVHPFLRSLIEWENFVAFIITEECTSCGACAVECPAEAIVEKDDKYVISENCEECGTCVDVCFLEAIKEIPEL